MRSLRRFLLIATLAFTASTLRAQFPQRMPPPPATTGAGSVLPPVAAANPFIRHELLVHVPTRLTSHHNASTISFNIDQSSLEPLKLSVGQAMITGLRWRVRVYSEDEPPSPSDPYPGIDRQIRFTDIGPITAPLPHGKAIAEIDLVLFETDIPFQHRWAPESPKYKVLWQRTLKQTIK